MASFFLETKTYAQSCFGRDLEAVLKTDVNSKVRVDRLLKENIKPPKIYMACGLSDSLLDANEDFVDYLKSNDSFITFEKGPGAHEWDFWDAYIKKFLVYLPLERAGAGMNSGNVGI